MNDIRLVATFEVDIVTNANRILSRADCATLAESLATDLVRQAELAGEGLLVVAGALFEPAELLRPGLPAWAALQDFARNTPQGPDDSGQILAIGAHQGRLPDSRLTPADASLSGQLLALPILLRSPDTVHVQLEEQLESLLFEKGGLHPPSRAAFSQASGLDTGHGQLMTLNDLIALTHVQMDTAGLGAFWPVVEQVLVNPDDDQTFALPGPLAAHWQGAQRSLTIAFQTFDDFPGPIEGYAVWTRAYRSLSALLSVHGIAPEIHTTHTLDEQRRAVVESSGKSRAAPGLTEQIHPDCGLLCWTLIEDQHQYHLYPLDSAGVSLLQQDFAARGLSARRPPDGVALTADQNALQAAPGHRRETS